MNLKESGRLRIVGKELIEDRFLTLTGFWRFCRKQVVEQFTGAHYFGEPYKVPNSDHITIAKPDGPEAIQHRLLCKFIGEMLESGHTPVPIPQPPPPEPVMLIDPLAAQQEPIGKYVEIDIPGTWLARPAGQPNAEWKIVTGTPGTVEVKPDELYQLVVSVDVDDNQLASLTSLSGLPGLRALKLSYRSPSDILQSLSRLRTLTVTEDWDAAWTDAALTDADLAHLSGLVALRVLSLDCKHLTDSGLAHLRGLTMLQELNLSGCKGVTRTAIDSLQTRLASCTINRSSKDSVT